MSNKAMMARHWKRITDLTAHNFDVENETFKLRNIMEAPLLKYKEEIEVVENDVLASLILQWMIYLFSQLYSQSTQGFSLNILCITPPPRR